MSKVISHLGIIFACSHYRAIYRILAKVETVANGKAPKLKRDDKVLTHRAVFMEMVLAARLKALVWGGLSLVLDKFYLLYEMVGHG